MKADDVSLAKEVMKLLLDNFMHNEILELAEKLPVDVAKHGRIKLYMLRSLR